MSDLLRFLEMGRRALFAHQSAMNTAGHNIANVQTDGYSRQRLNLTANFPHVTGLGIFGTGVNVDYVERVRSRFVDQQLMNERPSLGQYEFLADSLKFIEGVFNEPSEAGLNAMMDEFFNAFHDLATDPESGAMRAVVKEKAVSLASGFNRLHRQLSDYSGNLNKELELKINDVNRLTNEIAELNKKIVTTERDGVQASDFRDKRDLLVDELAKLVNIRTFENDAGAISVALGDKFVVVNTHVQDLKLKTSLTKVDQPTIVMEDGASVRLSGGSLKGLLDIRDQVIPGYLDELDELARTLANAVNTVHKTGFSVGGDTNLGFFVDNVQGAADLAVNPLIIENPDLIGTSSEFDTAGNNEVALAIANLQTEPTMQGGAITFGDFYNTFLTSVGTQTQESNFQKENFQLTVEKLEMSREAISGVSLDEEMTNLIEAQHAFSAAARFITTVDEMTTTILNML